MMNADIFLLQVLSINLTALEYR